MEKTELLFQRTIEEEVKNNGEEEMITADEEDSLVLQSIPKRNEVKLLFDTGEKLKEVDLMKVNELDDSDVNKNEVLFKIGSAIYTDMLIECKYIRLDEVDKGFLDELEIEYGLLNLLEEMPKIEDSSMIPFFNKISFNKGGSVKRLFVAPYYPVAEISSFVDYDIEPYPRATNDTIVYGLHDKETGEQAAYENEKLLIRKIENLRERFEEEN